jgi:hypothetical protein
VRKLFAALVVLVLGFAGSGCTLTHYVPLRKDFYVTPGAPDYDYEKIGIVHAEAWTPGFFYLISLSPGTSLESAQEALINEARNRGANAIIGLRCHVETHMPYLFIAGWFEYHLSGVAVRIKDDRWKGF